jgi:AraC-like DNA-binding protein
MRFFQPWPELRRVVARIYSHEADVGSVPEHRPWLIVPDGEIKLIFPSRGDISCAIGDSQRTHRVSRLIVSGMRSRPGRLLFHGSVEAIGVIVRPESAYRLFDDRHNLLANCTLDGEEIFGAAVRRWEDQLANLPTVEARVAALQNHLWVWLRRRERRDRTYEFAVRRLQAAEGCLRIERLAREVGWSRRTLERRFQEHAGVGAKALADILRFHAVYRHLRHPHVRYADVLGGHYFDQSHFLKAFKRYTGTTPRGYAATPDYGRLYIPDGFD